MESIDNLIARFRSKEESHPEMSKLWINYLILKKSKLNNLINQAENTLEKLSYTNDISKETILTMIILYENKFI
tara:strand:+ start:783 stop:1004 length:222 start_codon:yes stop_codon:yes gene_type:complete